MIFAGSTPIDTRIPCLGNPLRERRAMRMSYEPGIQMRDLRLRFRREEVVA
jgi:hypothetical protein